MAVVLNHNLLSGFTELDKTALMIQNPEATSDSHLFAAADHLTMTKEKLDYAVVASKRILQEAAGGKLPSYV
jgi:hypothetical protein